MRGDPGRRGRILHDTPVRMTNRNKDGSTEARQESKFAEIAQARSPQHPEDAQEQAIRNRVTERKEHVRIQVKLGTGTDGQLGPRAQNEEGNVCP